MTGSSSTVYELGIRDAKGQLRKLNLDGGWVSRDALEGAMGRPVTAEVEGGTSIMAMSSQNKPILLYENSVKTYEAATKSYRDMGAPMIMFGLPLLLIGFFLKRRSLNKAARAASAQLAA